MYIDDVNRGTSRESQGNRHPKPHVTVIELNIVGYTVMDQEKNIWISIGGTYRFIARESFSKPSNVVGPLTKTDLLKGNNAGGVMGNLVKKAVCSGKAEVWASDIQCAEHQLVIGGPGVGVNVIALSDDSLGMLPDSRLGGQLGRADRWPNVGIVGRERLARCAPDVGPGVMRVVALRGLPFLLVNTLTALRINGAEGTEINEKEADPPVHRGHVPAMRYIPPLLSGGLSPPCPSVGGDQEWGWGVRKFNTLGLWASNMEEQDKEINELPQNPGPPRLTACGVAGSSVIMQFGLMHGRGRCLFGSGWACWWVSLGSFPPPRTAATTRRPPGVVASHHRLSMLKGGC